MNNLVSIPKTDVVHFDDKKIELIRKTIAKDLTPNEFELYISIAKARGLDPILKQIHAVVRGQGENGQITFQVAIDGLRLIAARTGEYAGRDETKFTYKSGTHFPERASVTVYRFVNGQKCAWTASAKWEEYYPGDKMGFMWKKLPETMLEKCAEAKALRMAFPNDTSGLYVNEEMEQAPAPQRDVSNTQTDNANFQEELGGDPEGESHNLGDYAFPLGKKHKGKRLKDIDPEELRKYLDWFMGESERTGTPLNSSSQKAIEIAETYLRTLEMAR